MEILLNDVQSALSTSRDEILNQIERLKESLKEREREIRLLRQRWTQGKREDESRRIVTVKGVTVLSQRADGLNNAELRELAESLRQKIGTGVVCLGAVSEEKAFLVIAVSRDMSARLKANDLIRAIAPMIGGGGGGRADFAQAGGGQAGRLDEALESIFSAVEKAL
jgi:alanyl-tRNA synthetase